jgi:CheY-like chemotaxis protein
MSRILIIEDDIAYREALSGIFRLEGNEVVEAGSASEAISVVAGADFDFVVLDLILSKSAYEQQGLDVLEQLYRVHPATPVVAISNKADDYTVRQLGKFPNCCFCVKSLLTSHAYILRMFRHFRDTRDQATPEGVPETKIVVRGVSRRFHHVIRQYLLSFDAFLYRQAGIRAALVTTSGSMDSSHDDLSVGIYSDGESCVVASQLDDYLHLLDCGKRLAKDCMPIRPAGELQFADEVAHYSASLAQAYWDNTWCQYVPGPMDSVDGVVEISPVRVANDYKIRAGISLHHDVSSGYQSMEQKVTLFLTQGNTLMALHTLQGFSEQFKLKDVLERVMLQLMRLEGLIHKTEEDAEVELAAINLDILHALLPEIAQEIVCQHRLN